MAVKRLLRHVDIYNPWFREEWFVAVEKMRLEPGRTRGLVQGTQGLAHRIFIADLAYAQQGGIHSIRSNGGDVHIPMVPPTEPRAIRSRAYRRLGGIGTLIPQRTIPQTGGTQIGRFQKLDKEEQLAQGCHGCLGIPFHMDPASKSVDRNRRGRDGGGRALEGTHPERERMGRYEKSSWPPSYSQFLTSSKLQLPDFRIMPPWNGSSRALKKRVFPTRCPRRIGRSVWW